MDKNVTQGFVSTDEKGSFPFGLVVMLGVIVVSMLILGLKLMEVI